MAAATTAAPSAPAQAKAPQLVVPFNRAAKEHVETFADVTQVLDASSHDLGPFDIPAYGFMRGIHLDVTASGGVGGGATVAVKEDAPFSVLQEVTVLDVNGAPIVGPLTGYDLFLITKWGGYTPNSPDPKQDPDYLAPVVGAGASGNFAFQLRVPIEVSARDGLGSLANQNASSTYKLRVTVAPNTAVYSTAPATTQPSVRVQASLDAWTQPTATDLRGNPNATLPPAHGTTSYWSKTVLNLSSGFNTPRLPRVGNYIRNLIFIVRATSDGTRATGNGLWPDPAAIYWDTRLLTSMSAKVWRKILKQRYDFTGATESVRGRDNGVYVLEFAHDFDGSVGYEMRDGWLPTVQSTRLELQGTFGAGAAVTVLTNDVSPAGEVFI